MEHSAQELGASSPVQAAHAPKTALDASEGHTAPQNERETMMQAQQVNQKAPRGPSAFANMMESPLMLSMMPVSG
jgi:hypothetical protein